MSNLPAEPEFEQAYKGLAHFRSFSSSRHQLFPQQLFALCLPRAIG
jgi:hypothetical protein